MTDPTDFRRLRADLESLLRRQGVLDDSRAGCTDGSLRTLLGDISQRQTRQASRLMGRLGQPGMDQPAELDQQVELDRAPAAADAALANTTTLTNTTTQNQGAVARPATSAQGVPVLERRDPTPTLIQFKIPRPLDFHFTAGQSVKLELDGVRRSYSIVSAPHEEVLEFFVELVPGGQMSERLRQLRPGDLVSLGSPKGGLRFDDSRPQHLMIATVTGINPFISILRDYLHQGRQGHRFHLLQGASYQSEFGYREELEAIATSHPDLLTYRPTVSRPEEPDNAGWGGSRGRVDTITDAYLQQAGLNPGSTRIYACGHSGMLDAVTGRYRPQGYQVTTESYD